MRYFRRTAYGTHDSYKEGEILSETQWHAGFNGDKYWEEVIVTPKPQPKKFKRRMALFCWNRYQTVDHLLFELTEDKANAHYKKNELVRITDWVEVEFTERTDLPSTDYKVVS